MELKFSFPYWRAGSDAQNHSNDSLPLTNAQVLCGTGFSVVFSSLPLLQGVWILLSKAVGNNVELQKAFIIILLISEKAKYAT